MFWERQLFSVSECKFRLLVYIELFEEPEILPVSTGKESCSVNIISQHFAPTKESRSSPREMPGCPGPPARPARLHAPCSPLPTGAAARPRRTCLPLQALFFLPPSPSPCLPFPRCPFLSQGLTFKEEFSSQLTKGRGVQFLQTFSGCLSITAALQPDLSEGFSLQTFQHFTGVLGLGAIRF